MMLIIIFSDLLLLPYCYITVNSVFLYVLQQETPIEGDRGSLGESVTGPDLFALSRAPVPV